ncbi:MULTISPECIES: hypothetical protein [unclassified Rathayibacter]|nr:MULTISPECIES: hypothetical protein [unclassified Rathayibacter]
MTSLDTVIPSQRFGPVSLPAVDTPETELLSALTAAPGSLTATVYAKPY